MTSSPPPDRLAEALPGLWRVRASNLMHWLTAERADPAIAIEVSSSDPLELTVQERFTAPDGKKKIVVRTAVWTPHGFIGWGTGLKRFPRNHWSVPWISDDGVVALFVHELRGKQGDGIEVLVRDDESARDVRATVTAAWEEFGLPTENLAKLSWFAI